MTSPPQIVSSPLTVSLRQDGNLWALNPSDGSVVQVGTGGGGVGTLTDAPSDGQLYARQNGVWVPVQSMQGSSIANQAFYLRDEFSEFDWVSGATATRWAGAANLTFGQNPAVSGHWAQVGLPPNGYLMFNPAVTDATSLVSQNFNILKLAAVRWVIMVNKITQTGTQEWWAGFMNSTSSQQYGALFSGATGAGFTGNLPLANGGSGFVVNTTGLLVGTYNNVAASHYGYLQSNFMPTVNVWMDLIVVQTPTQVRFYAGNYGTPPPLVGAINNNICTAPTVPGLYNATGSDAITINVDFCEILLQPQDTATARFRGYDLANL